MEGNCLRCRAIRDIKNPARVRMKDGRPRIYGYCGICGDRMSEMEEISPLEPV